MIKDKGKRCRAYDPISRVRIPEGLFLLVNELNILDIHFLSPIANFSFIYHYIFHNKKKLLISFLLSAIHIS